jgi:ATP-dependent Lon protease
VLPLRNAVLFPAAVVPINVGRARSVRLIEELASTEVRLIAVVTQKSPETEDPGFEDLYETGVVARIVKVIKLGASNYSVLLQGLSRMRLDSLAGEQPYLKGHIERLPDTGERGPEVERLARELRDIARQLTEYAPPVPRELGPVAENAADPGALADLVTLHLPSPPVTPADRQQVLEAVNLEERLRLAHHLARRVHEVHRVRKEIQSLVSGEMGRSEREEILRAQLKTIKEELGETDDSEEEIDQLRERIAKAKLPYEVEKVARRQLGRLRAMQGHSAEYQVTRTYVEWLVDIPWNKSTDDKFDVEAVRRALDEDHYGLEKPKKRILEYSRAQAQGPRGPHPVLGGPARRGQDLARQVDRPRHRASVRAHLPRRRARRGRDPRPPAHVRGRPAGPHHPGDEEGRHHEPRAHARRGRQARRRLPRRSVGGAARGARPRAEQHLLGPLPRRALRPLEGAVHRHGQPARPIPAPLRDRMEVIEIPGYTHDEKLTSRASSSSPRQLESHGLTKTERSTSPTSRRRPTSSTLHARGRRTQPRARDGRRVPRRRGARRRAARTCTSTPPQTSCAA